ncbi:hypothetical protein PVAND_012440 [Polypedilum vanderplanki]|uniref:Uncharacterized protein n=1 Tax=Polypedilum vanderplanki TaxID=319348 RepID=A0A9J6CMF0_POLVA|nr:hypothetical protein PVAND_012440 [Polypedilum vanderplanki]
MSATYTKQTDAVMISVTLMLQKTGCLDKHYKVQECIAETQDWRQCQNIVKEFKDCMQEYTEKQRQKI